MPLPPPKSSALPSDLDPAHTAPGPLVQRLINRGCLPSATVDYPRLDDLGKPVCKVTVRLLTVREQDEALASARAYVSKMLASGKKGDGLDWRPDELEHNARITEILAMACREPDDLSKPFFEHGVIEARQHCTAEELGVLANVYASLANRQARLGEMGEAEMEAFLRAVEEGALQHPFSYCSREQLEILLEYAVKSWVAKGASSTGPRPTSS